MADYRKHKKRMSEYLQVMDLPKEKCDVVIKEVVEVMNCKLGMSKEDKYVIKLYPNALIKREIIMASKMSKQIAAFVQRKMVKDGVKDWKLKYRDTDFWKDIPVTIGAIWGKNPQEPNGEGEILYINPSQPKITTTGAVKKIKLTPESSNWATIIEWMKDEKNTIDIVKKKYELTKDNETLLCKKN